MIFSMINSILPIFATGPGAENLHDITFDFSLISSNHGYEIALIGYIVVFISLLVVALFFMFIGKVMIRAAGRKAKEFTKRDLTEAELTYPDEVNAAIAMALYFHFNSHHDEESGLLTMQKIERRYSPWSSKIYNITQSPFVK